MRALSREAMAAQGEGGLFFPEGTVTASTGDATPKAKAKPEAKAKAKGGKAGAGEKGATAAVEAKPKAKAKAEGKAKPKAKATAEGKAKPLVALGCAQREEKEVEEEEEELESTDEGGKAEQEQGPGKALVVNTGKEAEEKGAGKGAEEKGPDKVLVVNTGEGAEKDPDKALVVNTGKGEEKKKVAEELFHCGKCNTSDLRRDQVVTWTKAGIEYCQCLDCNKQKVRMYRLLKDASQEEKTGWGAMDADSKKAWIHEHRSDTVAGLKAAFTQITTEVACLFV